MATEQPKRKRWLTFARLGWILALIIFIVFLIYSKVMGARLAKAEAIPAQLESKLLDVTNFEASQALEYCQQIQIALGQQNWGSAGDSVLKIRAIVNTMDRTVPKSHKDAVAKADRALLELEKAVKERTDDARDKLDKVTDAIAPLAAR